MIVSVAGSLAGAGDVAIGVGADVATINKTTEAFVESNVVAVVEGDIFVTSDSQEDITAVAAGVGASGAVAVVVDAAVHVLDITTRAFVGDDPSDVVPSAGPGDVHANGSIVIAADERTEMDNVVGVAAASLYSSNGAAAGVVVANKRTEAFIGEAARVTADGNTAGLNVRTGRFVDSYVAANPGTPGIEANQDVNVDSDTSTLSAQGEVGLAELEEMDVDQQGGSDTNDESLTGQRTLTPGTINNFHGIAVTATNRDDIETYTLSLAVAIAGVATSGGVNVINADTTAYVGANANLNANIVGADALQSVHVAAGSDFHHFALAGSVAAGLVGVSPSVGVTVLRNSTTAFLGTNVTCPGAKRYLRSRSRRGRHFVGRIRSWVVVWPASAVPLTS